MGRKVNLPKNYKIGTRGSLLALTQCTQIKNQLEKLTGDKFELEVIKTEGDENTSLPLWQLDGKDFFTKELDQALLLKNVDLVVHSYKDLGSERPEGIQLAAVTKRSYPEDILLFKKSFFDNIQTKETIEVGTSSPRRMTNITSSLTDFLPGERKVTTKNLRGNVNTRIQKLLDGDFDMICLALAGIERLAQSEESFRILKELLKDLSFMILPPSIFPSAASQGALGIECLSNRDDDGELLQKLKSVHDQETFSEVKREREAFVSYGGGCHLAVGVHVKKWQNIFIHTHKGIVDEKEINIKEIEYEDGEHSSTANINELLKSFNKDQIFIGTTPNQIKHQYLCDHIISKNSLKITEDPLKSPTILYATSSHCIDTLKDIKTHSNHIQAVVAAGASTMRKLNKKNILTNFCADSHGDQEITRFMNSKAIQLLLGTDQNYKINVLTHAEGNSSLGNIIPCYDREINSENHKIYSDKISTAKVFYWTSYFQYQLYIENFPLIKDQVHFCGLGKTYKEFSKREIQVTPIELSIFIKKLN